MLSSIIYVWSIQHNINHKQLALCRKAEYSNLPSQSLQMLQILLWELLLYQNTQSMCKILPGFVVTPFQEKRCLQRLRLHILLHAWGHRKSDPMKEETQVIQTQMWLFLWSLYWSQNVLDIFWAVQGDQPMVCFCYHHQHHLQLETSEPGAVAICRYNVHKAVKWTRKIVNKWRFCPD